MGTPINYTTSGGSCIHYSQFTIFCLNDIDNKHYGLIKI